MRRSICAVTVIVGVFALATLHAHANLLSDSGFDTMSVQELSWGGSPWWGGGGGGTDSGGGGWITDAQSLSPDHSATLFLWGDDWAYSIVAQTVGSGITPGEQYDAIANFYRTDALGSGVAAFEIKWLNSGGSEIQTNKSATIFDASFGGSTWHSVTQRFTAPASAAGFKYGILYEKPVSGDPGDIWIDNASFAVAVPEPAAAAMLGFGLLLAIAVRRKYRK